MLDSLLGPGEFARVGGSRLDGECFAQFGFEQRVLAGETRDVLLQTKKLVRQGLTGRERRGRRAGGTRGGFLRQRLQLGRDVLDAKVDDLRVPVGEGALQVFQADLGFQVLGDSGAGLASVVELVGFLDEAV